MNNILNKIKLTIAAKQTAMSERLIPHIANREEKLIDKLARKAAEKAHPRMASDINRICELPICYPLTDEEVEAVNQMHVKVDAPDNFKLERVQAEALYNFQLYKRLFGPIEVGGGKTLISLRVCAMGHAEFGMRKTMLVVPPQVLTQLVQTDIPWARKRVPLGCTFHVLGGRPRDERLAIAQHQTRGCFLVPYSLLSSEDGTELLGLIRPELIVFDEAHNLKNPRAARTRRIQHYIRKTNPTVVALSGTITNKTIREFSHILAWSHGMMSPLPLDPDVVLEWAALVDADLNFWNPVTDQKVGTGPLRPLIRWSNIHMPHDVLTHDVEGFRRAVQNRLLTAPAVVASPADTLGVSLTIHNQPVQVADTYPGMEQLKKFDQDVEQKWMTPCGDEIEWAMHKFAHRYVLSAGIYHQLSWPDPGEWAQRKNISVDEANNQIEQSKTHHALLQDYHRQLREYLRYHQVPGLDSPFTIGNSMEKHGDLYVTKALYNAWKKAREAKFDDMPERTSTAIRVCDYKIKAAVKWAKQQERGGIIWYHHQGLGEWLAEEFTKGGVDAIHCPAGERYNRMLTDQAAPERFRHRFAICSMQAHSTGKNLQYFDRQYFVQFPRPEETAQQVLGRTHRKGQQADEVLVYTCISTEIDEIALAATLNDSVYVFETMASKRKVLFATWNPMPSIYGAELLARAGADAKQLNIRQRAILAGKFGIIKSALAS